MHTYDKHYDIVLIDSGCNSEILEKYSKYIDAIAIEFNNYNLTFSKNISDNLGHGTEITKCIFSVFSTACIMIIKAFDQFFSIDDKHLLQILKFIDDNIKTSFISISGGILKTNQSNEIHELCKKLRFEKDIVIVGAMGNDKSIRYSGGYDCVLGVDILNNSNNIFFLKDHYVNFIVGSKKLHSFTRSTSLAVSYIVAYLAKLKCENKCCNFAQLEALITDNQTEIYNIHIQKRLHKILVLALDDFQNLQQKLSHFGGIEVVLATHKYRLQEACRYFHTVLSWSKADDVQKFDLIINYNIDNLKNYMNSNTYNWYIQSTDSNHIPFLKIKQNKLFFENQYSCTNKTKILLKDYDIFFENENIECDSTLICSDGLSINCFNIINSLKNKNPHSKYFYVDNILSILNEDAFIEAIGQSNVAEIFHRSALYMRWSASNQQLPLITIVTFPSLLSNKYSKENIIDFDTIVKQTKCQHVIFLLEGNNEYSVSVKKYIEMYKSNGVKLSIINVRDETYNFLCH